MILFDSVSFPFAIETKYDHDKVKINKFKVKTVVTLM